MSQGLYTINGSAAYLALSRSTVYNLLASGALQAVKVGDRQRLTKAELDRYVSSLPPSKR